MSKDNSQPIKDMEGYGMNGEIVTAEMKDVCPVLVSLIYNFKIWKQTVVQIIIINVEPGFTFCYL